LGVWGLALIVDELKIGTSHFVNMGVGYKKGIKSGACYDIQAKH
jgi:hypothetical protein